MVMKKIGELEITDQSKLVLAIGEYRDRGERIDLRLFVKSKDGGKHVPTKKGVFFSSEYLPHFIEIVNRLKDE